MNNHISAFEHRVVAPAKLIITGEYSVMYGKPAIAIPLHDSTLKVEAKWQPAISSTQLNSSNIEIVVHIRGEEQKLQTSAQQVRKIYTRVQRRRRRFLRAESVKLYVISPEEFINCAIHLAAFSHAAKVTSQKQKPIIAEGLSYKLILFSTIPFGSGLGSSAATIAAILKAINPSLSDEKRFQLACKSEDFVHGKSGLLDPWITIYNQACYWQNHQGKTIELRLLNYVLINTGKPQSSTASCVQQVKKQFPSSHPIWQNFESISMAIADSIQAFPSQQTPSTLDTPNALIPLVQKNQRLLEQLGVVPNKVRAFISAIEELGYGAKITGAGSVSGENGGIVIVFSSNKQDILCNDFASLIEKYNYQVL